MKISPKAPSLILRKINESKLALREWSIYTAFQRGVADHNHYYILVDIANILMMAGSSDKKRQYVRDYIKREVEPIIDAIRDRYSRTNKIGCSGLELKGILKLIEFNDEFWKRQPGELYAVVINEYNKILEARKNAT